MLLGWKMQRCLVPQRHHYEKCPGYHVVQYKPNGNTPIFDARRPPLKAGKLLYHAVHCKEGSDSSTSSHYSSCAAGAGCDKSHSLLELFYNPGHFKQRGCEVLKGGRCANSEAGRHRSCCCSSMVYDSSTSVIMLGLTQARLADTSPAGHGLATVVAMLFRPGCAHLCVLPQLSRAGGPDRGLEAHCASTQTASQHTWTTNTGGQLLCARQQEQCTWLQQGSS